MYTIGAAYGRRTAYNDAWWSLQIDVSAGQADGMGKGFTCETCLQGEYCLSYGAVGTRVALIASEPITGQAGDWVAVPNNTALVVISEKVSLNILA